MGSRFPIWPQQASALAGNVDNLFLFLLAVAIFFSVGIFCTIFYFAVKYRRRSANELPPEIHGSMTLEVLWSVVPFGLTMIMFFWGAELFYKIERPPDDALEVYVVAKQWMWKLQHKEGQREINELHIPYGRSVKLIMTSQDVIHSFYVPAFRTKQDVLPGRYTTTWFKPNQIGTYHLFCAEYCGTKHSGMIGWVYVMPPDEYQAWLSGGKPQGSLAQGGEKLFQDMGCANCHHADGHGRCPSLVGLFGSKVPLSTGATVTADADYLRESILAPDAKIVAGYQPIMPTFQGLLTEEGVMQLIEYIKSMGPHPGAQAPIGSGTTTFESGGQHLQKLPSNATTVPSQR